MASCLRCTQQLTPGDSDSEDDDHDELYDSSEVQASANFVPSDSESEDPDAPAEPPQRQHGHRAPKRLIHSLDGALDSSNYHPFLLPTGLTERFPVQLSKATRGDPGRIITWVNKKPHKTGRQQCRNVLRNTPGVRNIARQAKTEVEAFSLFFDDSIINKLVIHTNKRIADFRDSVGAHKIVSDKVTHLHNTDFIEVKALLGMMFACGLLQQNLQDVHHLFQDRIGHPIFGATMSRDRFCFLMSKLGFDNQSTRPECYHVDRFAAFCEIFEDVNQNCSKVLVPDEYLALDETSQNRSGLKVYNKNKPARYGLLFKSINAVRYPFTFTMMPYAGKPPAADGPYYEATVLESVQYLVKKLQRAVDIKGRNLTADRYYTSIDLCEWLLKQNMTMVGTMQAKRRGIPQEIKTVQNKDEHSYKVYWEQNNPNLVLNSYVVKTKSTGMRNVLVLCSIPPLLGTTKDDGKSKPGIYKFYDFSKGEADVVDQRMATLTTKSKSRNWAKNAFAYTLDVARINSQTILSMNLRKDPRNTSSFDFGWNLSMQLILHTLNADHLMVCFLEFKQK